MLNFSPKDVNWKLLALNLFEVIVVLVIAIFFELFDSYFTYEKKRLGIIIGVIGTLIIISRFVAHEMLKSSIQTVENQYFESSQSLQKSLSEELRLTRQKIDNISKIIDINDNIKVGDIKRLFDIYLNITEEEFTQVKSSIVDEAISSLNNIKNNKRSEELAASEYYKWLLPILESVSSGQKVKAVSCMFDSEWDDSPAEERFLAGNVNAAKNGAVVERIFLTNTSTLQDAIKLEAVKKHAEKHSEENLKGLYAYKDKIQSKEPSLLDEIGHGFIIFDSRVALIDKFDKAGHVRGIVTMNEKDIRDLEKAFDKLKLYSVPLRVDDFKQIKS